MKCVSVGKSDLNMFVLLGAAVPPPSGALTAYRRNAVRKKSNIRTTFAGLLCGRGLAAPPGGVPLASTSEQQVDEGLGALQGALLLCVLPFLLLLFLLRDLCGGVATVDVVQRLLS